MLINRPKIAISLGAIAGAISRYYLTNLVKDAGFIATFGINVVGCLLIAYLMTLPSHGKKLLSPEVKLMMTSGFCGSFTTFSSYELDLKTFINNGNINLLILYGLGSAIGGIIGVQLGVNLAKIHTFQGGANPKSKIQNPKSKIE